MKVIEWIGIISNSVSLVLVVVAVIRGALKLRAIVEASLKMLVDDHWRNDRQDRRIARIEHRLSLTNRSGGSSPA